MAIIDLGDVSAPDFVAEQPAPVRRPRRPRLTHLIAAALTVLSAAALTGSGRPAPSSFTEAWSTEVGLDTWPFPFGDIVTVSRGAPGATPESTGYDLATGRVRWTVRDPSLTSWLNPDPDSGQLYTPAKVKTVQLDNGTMFFGTDTRTLDAHTGKLLWERHGDELAATAGEVLLGDRDGQGRVTALRLVRAADGTTIWERPVAVADNVVVDEEPADAARIVLTTEAGALTTLRWADGVPLATRRVDRPTGQTGWGPQVLKGQFYDVQRTGSPGTTIVAYRTDTLAELWRFETTGEVYVQDCGPVLCLNDTHLINGVDPATGERRWDLPSGNATPLPGGRLLINEAQPGAAPQTVLDATTGRTLATAPRDVQVLAVGDGRLLILRDTKDAPYRVTISDWDPDTGRITLLGAIPGRADTCQISARHLLCTGSGRLSVTDLG